MSQNWKLFYFWKGPKKFDPIGKEFKYFWTLKVFTNLFRNMGLGSGTRDPRSGKNSSGSRVIILTVLNSWWAERTPPQTEGRYTRAGRSHHSQFQVSRTFFRFHLNVISLSWTNINHREAFCRNKKLLFRYPLILRTCKLRTYPVTLITCIPSGTRVCDIR